MQKIKHIIIYIIVLFLLITFLIPFTYVFGASTDSIYVWSSSSVSADSSDIDTHDGNFLELTSGSAILIDQKSGNVLYDHNMHEKLRPASVTKIMTLLLIMEAVDSGQISLEDQVSCSEKASKMGGSQIWLDQTETLTVHEMLKAICVVSANDCSVAMAEHLAGSEELFVDQMNKRAKELGMNDTTFKNCHGIDEDDHLTSAYDISLMSRELMQKHPTITNYTTIWMDSLRGGQSELVNTNKLVRNYNGCTGLKTGSTSIALFNLSATATRDDLSLIAVIMKGETSAIRFSEAQKLLDYGFKNFEYSTFSTEGEILKTIEIDKGIFENVDVIFENDSGTLIKKGASQNLSTNILLPDKVSAPVSEGQKLGEITYSIDNKTVGIVSLIANSDVKKLTFPNMLARTFEDWFTLLR